MSWKNNFYDGAFASRAGCLQTDPRDRLAKWTAGDCPINCHSCEATSFQDVAEFCNTPAIFMENNQAYLVGCTMDAGIPRGSCQDDVL